eukprot:2349490-Prorocentrum_lima.AAC.1
MDVATPSNVLLADLSAETQVSHGCTVIAESFPQPWISLSPAKDCLGFQPVLATQLDSLLPNHLVEQLHKAPGEDVLLH